MSYKIIGKYIKELNFNIPNTKTFFLLSKDIKNYKIKIDINSNKINQNVIEVLTSLTLSPVKNDFDEINTLIIFAAVIEIQNDKIQNKELENIILVDVPSKIYGDLRKIFIDLFEKSGFKDIKISEKVDFQELYKMRKVQ
tara:strand:- start:474 stop:893 length:420 start_codon:yes stop_codon:yes gene_type:complete